MGEKHTTREKQKCLIKPYCRLTGWEMNLLRRMRASSPYGASSDPLKPNFVREKEKATF